MPWITMPLFPPPTPECPSSCGSFVALPRYQDLPYVICFSSAVLSDPHKTAGWLFSSICLRFILFFFVMVRIFLFIQQDVHHSLIHTDPYLRRECMWPLQHEQVGYVINGNDVHVGCKRHICVNSGSRADSRLAIIHGDAISWH